MTGPVLTILAETRRRGIRLRADGDRLLFQPVSAMTADLAERLKAHKPTIPAVLQRQVSEAQPVHDGATQSTPAPTVGQPEATPDVPGGWTPAGWAGRLRYLAGICIHPGRAKELREWAESVEAYFHVAPVPWTTEQPAKRWWKERFRDGA